MADHGSGRWSVYCSCSLCANKSPTFGGDDPDVAHQEAEAWAAANGWLALPERTMLVGPRRFQGHICRACVIDLRRLLPRRSPMAASLTEGFAEATEAEHGATLLNLLSRPATLDALKRVRLLCDVFTSCPRCGAEPWVNIDCPCCEVMSTIPALPLTATAEPTAGEDEAPYVCPGCHAVAEPCAPGCIDASMEAERREAIESGDYDDSEDYR